MAANFIASSSITIHASADRVWQVLTDPQAIKEFMFGAEVHTDWTVGGPIVWRGVWRAKSMRTKVSSSNSSPRGAW